MIRRQSSILVIVFVIFSFSLTHAQSLMGKLVGETSGDPLVGVLVVLKGGDDQEESLTNAQGVFRFWDVQNGRYDLSFDIDGNVTSHDQPITLTGELLDLGTVMLTAQASTDVKSDIGTIVLDDSDFESDESASGVSSLLTASRDPFVNSAAYNLSVGRFRQRGYGNEDQLMYLNGFPVNDLDDGRVLWATWGGLNDILRVQQANYDLSNSPFSFGGMLGARNIDLSASSQRPQTKLVYNYGNRSYTHRAMLTHSSGEQANGWAYTISGSRRWGNSGYTPGTFYDSWSYAVLVDKKINDKHLLNFSVLGSPTKRGRNGVSTQEVYDLVGSNYYNPNWGYQNGKVRNSRMSNFHQPYFMLRHDWKINENMSLSSTAGYNTGYFGNSRLDWFNAPDPRPDYYRKLPSYQLTDDLQKELFDYFKANPDALQVDFDHLYGVNKTKESTFTNDSGSYTGYFSKYIIEDQRFDNEKKSLNTVLTAFLSENATFTGGVNYLSETNHQYRVVNDLLGGDYYLDLDKFAERDFPDNPDFAQNDLQNPNRVLQEGDVYGWNYDIVTTKIGGWAQTQVSTSLLDYFVAGELSSTTAHRFGYYQNGKFPDNSLGKSAVQSFLNYGVKGGLTYKLDGRNYFYGRGTYRTRAPFSRNIFVSARTRDTTAPEDALVNETILGGEVGYVFRYPGVKGRITGFYTEFRDQMRSTNIYFDASNSFGNYLLYGVDKVHQGLEIGAEFKLTSTITASTAIALGANQYNNRPSSRFTADNDALDPELPPAEENTIYLKNYYLPGTHNAASLGLEYRSPKFWFISLTGNYFNNTNIDLFPERRTDRAVDGIVLPSNRSLFDDIIGQYELKDQFVLNVFAGKSFKFDDYYLLVNISGNNLLNNKELITGGFEQYRYRERDPDVFPERLFYAWGTNYSIGVTLRY